MPMWPLERRSEECSCGIVYRPAFAVSRVSPPPPVRVSVLPSRRMGPEVTLLQSRLNGSASFLLLSSGFTPMRGLAVFACSLFQLFLLIKKPNWE